MTAPARIYLLDMERALKAVERSGVERARVIMDLENRKIEVIIGESANAADGAEGDWTDDD